MIIIQKIIIAVRTVGFINFLLNFIMMFNKDTPQTIKITCNEKLLQKVDRKIQKYKSIHNTRDSKFSVIVNDIQLHYAGWYRHKADIYWGRPSQLDRYKCAWFYVTSGELYKLANDLDSASNQFHFAACQFRDVGALNQSIKHYIKALELSRDPDWKERNKARAIAMAKMAGEDEAVELIANGKPNLYLQQTRSTRR